jgi:ubiquinone/menaquinone biosynthesis C-methylase UbiE
MSQDIDLDLNPQAREMADESMVRNLALQAEAIWPQEAPLLRRYGIQGQARILDAGCGTGEASVRLAASFPQASVLGVDILDEHLERARRRAAGLGGRVSFEHRTIFDTGLPSGTFDLTVCRHVVHSVPHVDRVLTELARVTRPGGWLHLIAEDYGMVHFPRGRLDPFEVWPAMPREYGPAAGIDLFIGRRAPGLLRAVGLEQIAVDYVVVDTLRVPRETFAAIWTAWRDGFAEAIGGNTSMSAERARAHFDDQIATLRDPEAYAVWMVPVVSARVPFAH